MICHRHYLPWMSVLVVVAEESYFLPFHSLGMHHHHRDHDAWRGAAAEDGGGEDEDDVLVEDMDKVHQLLQHRDRASCVVVVVHDEDEDGTVHEDFQIHPVPIHINK